MNMMNKCTKFHKDSPSRKKKLNIQSRERDWTFGGGRFCVQLCIETYIIMEASNFGGTFDQLWIFFMKFSQLEDASLLFLYHGAKVARFP